MRVLFFAQLKDVTECNHVDLTLVASLDGEQLWAILLDKFPGLANYRSKVRLARNWEYADSDTMFADLDEVALIPPVSGG